MSDVRKSRNTKRSFSGHKQAISFRDARKQCSLLRSERDAKQLEYDDVKHRYNLLEQSSANAPQERTHTLNKTVAQEKTIAQQTQTMKELREQAVAQVTEIAKAKAEAISERKKSCEMEKEKNATSECKLAPGMAEWNNERKGLISRIGVLEANHRSMAAMLDQAAAQSKENKPN